MLREEQTGFEAFVKKMTINLEVFGTLVKDWIMGNVQSCLIVIPYWKWQVQGNIKLG